MLANHLWQSTLFVALVWALTLALKNNRASVRYWLWLAASVKFLIPFSLLVGAGSHVEWRAPRPLAPPPQISIVATQIAQPFLVPSETVPAQAVLPKVLYAIWFCGFTLGLVFWCRSLLRMRAIQRAATPLPLRFPIPVMSSPARLEPGVFGIRKSVLILPEGITTRLTPAQLDAVFAHELCHVHRRDNLTGAIHMLVEVIFWFHPLVWWIRRQLVAERERACDEAVVQSAGDPEVYAEGILNVCRFYLESPTACVSGVTGADLKKRIADIVAGRTVHNLTFAKRVLLAIAGIVAVAGPVAIGILHAQAAAPLKFEVASVKAVNQPWLQIRPDRSGGRITWSTDLHYLIEYAYRMQPFRVSGPVPGSESIYRVDVKTDPAATEDQVRLMFRSLLAERFHMESHRVTRESDGYALTIAKGGFKLKQAKPEDPPPPLPAWCRPGSIADFEGKIAAILPERGVVGIIGRRVSLFQLSESLQRVLQTMVWDETGIRGNYYFGLHYAREDHPDEVNLPSLEEVIQRDLGLKLEKRKGPVEMLVVDRIEKTPTEND